MLSAIKKLAASLFFSSHYLSRLKFFIKKEKIYKSGERRKLDVGFEIERTDKKASS